VLRVRPNIRHFLYLFFPDDESGREAGLDSLRRLDAPLGESKSSLNPEALAALMQAATTFRGYWDRIEGLTRPILVANGAHDVMIDAWAVGQCRRDCRTRSS
jgi:hypothetical protein